MAEFRIGAGSVTAAPDIGQVRAADGLFSLPSLRLDPWAIAAILVAALIGLPIAAVVWLSFGNGFEIWSHLVGTVLAHYALTTLFLMVGVGLGTALIGVSTAWAVTIARFPGHKIFEWALLLPLAMPGYIVAYVYTDLLEYAGPVQTLLRDLFGWSSRRDYWFPEIRSLGGACLVLTVTLYPYVYLLARTAFLEQSVTLFEASRSLGRGAFYSFCRVALPMARPAIVVGVILALMETLNDYGTVDFFAVNSFTVGIVSVWTNMSSTAGAAQMSLSLLTVILALLWLERSARRQRRFHGATARRRPLPSRRLQRLAAIGATLACLTPILLGFVVPIIVLGRYAFHYYHQTIDSQYWSYLLNSLGLSGTAALLASALALLLAYAARVNPSPVVRVATRFAGFGYAIPGAVLAVGLIVPLAAFDNSLDDFLKRRFDISVGLLLSGSMAIVVFGFVARFIALSLGSIESGLTRIGHNMDDAARTLGSGPSRTFRRVHWPLLRGSALAGAIFVFVDSMKELPMTVLLRPFNFETLATFVHQYASDEMLEQSAFAALTIVVAGMLPVMMLSHAIRHSRPHKCD